MSTGLRNITKEWIDAEHRADPLALGPILGQTAITMEVPNALLAKTFGVHEQTMLRWMTRRARIPAYLMLPVLKMLAFLWWVRDEQYPPLVGTTEQKEQQLAVLMTQFLATTGARQTTTPSA